MIENEKRNEFGNGQARQPLSIEAAGVTICGPVRAENQDAFMVDGLIAQKSGATFSIVRAASTPFSVAVVDGMGGYAGGDQAALLVACNLSKCNLDGNDLLGADAFCNRLSEKVSNAGLAWGTPEMGAAFAMLTLREGNAVVANVGDCRIYRLRSGDGVLGLLSEDDRVRGTSRLTQSIGGGVAYIDAHGYSEPVEESDMFVLCSDGVWGTLEDGALLKACEVGSPHDIVKRIADECWTRRAQDNCTAVVVRATFAKEAGE